MTGGRRLALENSRYFLCVLRGTLRFCKFGILFGFFLNPSKKLRKQADFVLLFSSCRLKSFLLYVGSAVVILPCPCCFQTAVLLHALLQAAPGNNFEILVTVDCGSWLIRVKFHAALQS